MSSSAIEVKNLCKRYGEMPALKGISFDVPAGSCVSLLGASGSGKTTTLRLIAGFETVDSGQIVIGGQVVNGIPAHKRDLAVVFQNFALFPHMTVEQNIAYPLETRRLSKRERRERIGKVLDLVHLPGIEARFPKQLSGGQQQRVALARALVYEPKVLLMDEALSALDKKLRDTLQVEIRSLQKELGITMIVVTHDQAEAMVMSDVIALMNNGRIEQIGAPLELYQNPSSHFVASFIGECNLIAGNVVQDSRGCAVFESRRGLKLPADRHRADPGADSHLAVRPEDISLLGEAKASALATGTVLDAINLGDCVKYKLALASGDEIFAKVLSGRSRLFAPGDAIAVEWQASDARILPGA